jgi:hypothetical protein
MNDDAWDIFDEASPAPASAPARTYDVPPDGECEVEIIRAEVGAVAWRATAANPNGDCLQLRLSAGSAYGFIFCDLPRDKGWLFKSLAEALGIQPDANGKVSIGSPDGLVGRRCRVELGHYQSKSGQQRPCVKRWLSPMDQDSRPTVAAAPASSGKPPRPKSSPRKAAPPPLDSDPDDIPF